MVHTIWSSLSLHFPFPFFKKKYSLHLACLLALVISFELRNGPGGPNATAGLRCIYDFVRTSNQITLTHDHQHAKARVSELQMFELEGVKVLRVNYVYDLCHGEDTEFEINILPALITDPVIGGSQVHTPLFVYQPVANFNFIAGGEVIPGEVVIPGEEVEDESEVDNKENLVTAGQNT